MKLDESEAAIARICQERDDARAKLAALETQYHADSDRWIHERDEARAIALRLIATGARMLAKLDIDYDLDDPIRAAEVDAFEDALLEARRLPWANDA
jgi:hypothetical protein